MKIKSLTILLVLSTISFAQINLNGLLNKKGNENNTSTSAAIEMLFSNKLNADGSKTGIEFKNEFGINEELYASLYLDKKLQKYSEQGRLYFTFYIGDKKLREIEHRYNTSNKLIQFGIFFNKEFTSAGETSKYWEADAQYMAPVLNAITGNTSNKTELTIVVSDHKAHTIFTSKVFIKNNKGECYKYNHTFEKDVPAKNLDNQLKTRLLNQFKTDAIVVMDLRKSNQVIKYNPSEYTVIDARIIEKDWVVFTDSYTGAILYHSIGMAVKFKDSNGCCFYSLFEFKENYDGKSFSQKSLSITPWTRQVDYSYDAPWIHTPTNYVDCN
jgi:hypothetical protein